MNDISIPAGMAEKDDVTGTDGPPGVWPDFQHVAFKQRGIHARPEIPAEKNSIPAGPGRAGYQEAAIVIAESLGHVRMTKPDSSAN